MNRTDVAKKNWAASTTCANGGEPVQIYEPDEGDPFIPPELPEDDPFGVNDVPPATDTDDETVVVCYPPPDISLPQGVAEPRPKYYLQGRPVKG